MRYLLALTAFAFSLCAVAAPPKLALDCSVATGTTIDGTAKAGKITLGDRPDFGYSGCTIALAGYSKVPSCSAVLESNGDPDYPLDPYPLGTITTRTTLFVSAIKPGSGGSEWDTGYVVSYLCVGQ